MRGLFIALLVLSSAAQTVSAQALRDQITRLFIFGEGEDQLFLAGSAASGVPAVSVHADHFIPSAVESNGTLINFLANAISSNVSNIPISAASSGITFRFEAGVPVPTSTSPGPIFAERGQTLGRGRGLIGVSLNAFNFKSIRGVDLSNLRLNFTHVNVDSPECDDAVGEDCAPQGVPALENEIIEVDLNLDIDVLATLFVFTYGLHDRVDIGLAVPVISTSLSGRSEARIQPFGGPEAAHFFGGTSTNPVLSTSQSVKGSAIGIGDVAARLKIALGESGNTRVSLLADARFPTGDEADFHGAGETAVRGIGVVSAQFRDFSPHVNVGYLYRSGEFQNDAFIGIAGFDQVLAPWATLAVEFLSEIQIGSSNLSLPEPLVIDQPFERTVLPSNIPTERDDVLAGSVGFKFVTPSGLTFITNALWPLNRGGMRTNTSWTAGLEYNF